MILRFLEVYNISTLTCIGTIRPVKIQWKIWIANNTIGIVHLTETWKNPSPQQLLKCSADPRSTVIIHNAEIFQ